MFSIAGNTLSRYYGKQSREVETVDMADVPDPLVTAANNKGATTPAFEFFHWMAFLDSREREALTLQFIEAGNITKSRPPRTPDRNRAMESI